MKPKPKISFLKKMNKTYLAREGTNKLYEENRAHRLG
jgi:hypothetical protein